MADVAKLLGAVADALNACERAGVVVQLAQGAVWTDRGYVLDIGDPKIGCRWGVRTRLPREPGPEQEPSR